MATETAPIDTTEERTGPLWWIGRIASWLVLLFVLVILFAAVVIPKIGDATPYTVLTSSMVPTYPPGTLIVSRKVDPNTLGVGTPVTYQIRSGQPDVITHRVVSTAIDKDGNHVYTTRGDNNAFADENPVIPEQIRGAVWYSIPYLGYVNNWLTGARRTTVVYIIAGALIVFALYQFVGAGLERSRRRTSR